MNAWGTRDTPDPPAARAYQACRQRCSSATARWCTARADPPSTKTPCPARSAMAASPICSTARRALPASLTGPSYSSTRARLPPPRAELWSKMGGSSARSAQTVPNSGWLCTAHTTSWRACVEREVKWDPEWHGPVPLDHAALEIDAQQLRGSQLGPGQEPRVAQQGAVAQVDGDVSRQVVVVALAPQRAGQDDQLLARVRSGINLSAVGMNIGNAPLSAAARCRAAGGGRASPRSHSTWPAARPRGCGPSTPQ